MMVGRDVLLRVDKTPASPGEVALEVDDLHVRDDRGLEKVRGVSFDVRSGEIVAIAGVDGNGQTELIEAITGLPPIESGTIVVGGKRVEGRLTARRDARRRRRAHPGGPPAARARARVQARREHRAARLRQAARPRARLALPSAGSSGARRR